MTTRIKDGTFAAACFNDNTATELWEALDSGPDAADMAFWGLTEQEWREQILLAIRELGEHVAETVRQLVGRLS